MLIRDATSSDVERITEIYQRHVLEGTASFELEPPTQEVMAERFKATHEAGYPYLAMEDEKSRVIGYAYGGAYRPRAAYLGTVEDSIYLDEGVTGQGLGGTLLSALLERLSAQKFHTAVGIVSDPEVNARSVRLHERLGFEQFGRAAQIGRKFDRWIDVVYLQKML